MPMTTNDTIPTLPKIRGFKLVSGESLISWSSGPVNNLYIFHNPYKFLIVVNPANGTISGTQLFPWIETNNDSPVIIENSKIITTYEVDQEYKKIYCEMIFSRKNPKSSSGTTNDSSKEDLLDNLTIASFNPEIQPKKSKAPIELVFDKDSQEDFSNDPFEEDLLEDLEEDND